MDASPSTPENVESPQGEMSREKLVQKCKNLLTIAQKAKTARDDAIGECGKLQKEVEEMKNALETKTQQYKNVEEIMGVLTEQKLKLAMDIDTLKKEKANFINQLKDLASEKEQFENEAESFKRRYNRLLSENEDLIGELQIRERSESQLLGDIKKLHENNESVKILCTNVTQEKLQLEAELERMSRSIEEMKVEREAIDKTLGHHLGVEHVTLENLVSFFDGLSQKSVEQEGKLLNISEDTSNLTSIKNENELLQREVDSLKDKIQKLMLELETANVDRYQMMSNLEDVRVETKTLIENVEKLNEEVEAVKEEKNKSEMNYNKVIETKNEEIEHLLNELSKNKAYVDELLSNMEVHMVNSNKFTEMNEELMKCKEELEALKRSSEQNQNMSSSRIDCNVLLTLKEGIVSNLTDLADTMPEYSKEFLNKLNAILEGADCKEGVGADIFVHYFNECLSQLKISLKENEILSKEVAHLNNSVKELENLVAAHNKDCEQLRADLEELSSDSNRLLQDLGHLRHENSLRVSEVSELMERLKLKDDEMDQLKESKNQIEFELHEQIMELSTKLTDSNNNLMDLQERNNELESKCQTHSKTTEELRELRECLNATEASLAALQDTTTKKTEELNQANIRLAECASLIDELSEVKEELANVSNLHKSCAERFEGLKVDYEKIVGDNKVLEEKTLQLQSDKKRLLEDLKTAKDDCGAAKLELNDTKSKLKLMDEEVNGSQVELKNTVFALQEELSLLKNIHQQTMEELESAKEQVSEKQGAITRLEEEQKILKCEMVQLEKSMQEEKSLFVAEVDKLKQDLQSKVDECEHLKMSISTNQSLQTRVEELEEALKLKSTEVEDLKKLLVEESERMAELRKSSNSQGIRISELEKTIFEKEAELAVVAKRLEENDAEKMKLLEENGVLAAKIAEMEKAVHEISNDDLKELQDRLMSTQSKLEDQMSVAAAESEQKNKILTELNDLCSKVQCLQAENNTLQEKLMEQGSMMNQELKKERGETKKLLVEVEELKEMVSFKKMELDDINCIWAGRLNTFKLNLISLSRSINELRRQSAELQNFFLNTISSLKNVIVTKEENVVELSVAKAKKELLDEMHRMNEALKDRGGAIAQLQASLAETEGELKVLTKANTELSEERMKLENELKAKEEKISSGETVIRELEAELGRLKEIKESAHESDVLSTSTISRAEDQMRLKEVDDSIEEKYLRLRQIAVKLKKRVSELNQTLEQEKSEKNDIVEKMQHLSSVAKNAQKVQETYDKTLDELEASKKQNVAMSASLKETKAVVDGLKKQIVSLESINANIPLMKKQIESLNSTIRDLKCEFNKLEMEKKVEVMKYEESKKQCAALESKVESLSQSLDQAVQQGRSNNVLELEMKNYEKVIADLTAQLNNEKQKLLNVEKECSSVISMKSGLDEQIALLEKQVKAEQSRNENLQEQLSSMRENSNSCQRQTEELTSQMSDLKRELQHAKSAGEQQALEMSVLTSEFSRKEIEVQSKIESFSSHIQSLETSLATVKQELLTSNSEKEHLREEFESYRMRAQSTLARQKGDSVSQGEKEAREQLDKLKKELDVAREKMENNQTEIETMNNKLSSLQMEKARGDKRYEDMTKALHQKITDYDTLNTEYRAFKFSAETLLHNTKTDFEEKERSLKEEITTLKNLVDSLNERISRDLKDASLEVDVNNGVSSNVFETLQHQDVLPSLQEREDGEGSESVPPPMSNFRRLSNLVPLDILLNNPIDDENRIPVLQEQIEKLHSELSSYEIRVKHLASLLSEAEKDSARSAQQNSVLKEELRRLERSLQREPHIANSEYLKNVIFKFLILQNGDERTRLVPVLDTILKLSPEEHNRLTAVAKGETSSSWGSYLHSWTGL